MIAFLALPLGAILILLLHLTKMPRRSLIGVFFATLACALTAGILEMVFGAKAYHLGGIWRIDDFTRFFLLVFVFVTGLGGVALFSRDVDEATSGSAEIISALLLLAA